jgi:hypothetical protein
LRIRLLLALLLASLAAAAFAPAGYGAVSWCGRETALDVQPDVAGGRQIHVVYAIPADGRDRFASVAPDIASDVEAMDQWWRGQDPTRAPRWDLANFPGCASRFGGLDISSVRLPGTSADYARLGEDELMQALSRDLTQGFSPLSDFSRLWKKYLVYYDGPTASSDICGVSRVFPDSGGPLADSFVFLQSSDCQVSYGDGRGGAVVALHELVHNLGGVAPEAPNTCPDHPGHVCDSPNDLLYWKLTSDVPLASEVLDWGHDDYYAHNGSWWDVQDSGWLLHALEQRTLSLLPSGQGSVRLREAASGFETTCGAACTTEWDAGADVTLEAQPAKGFGFEGWSGPCVGTSGACVLPLTSSLSLSARFARRLTLRLRIAGQGRVTSVLDSFRCTRASCTKPLLAGDEVALVARPAKGWRLERWSGACHGRGICSLTAGARSPLVVATFARLKG